MKRGFDDSDVSEVDRKSKSALFADMLKRHKVMSNYPNGLCRKFIPSDVEMLKDTIQKDVEDWYASGYNAPGEINVSGSMLDDSSRMEFMVPGNITVSIEIVDDIIFMSSYIGDYDMDETSAVLRNTMYYLRDICVRKQLKCVKVFVAGILDPDFCYKNYAKDLDYKMGRKNGWELNPMSKEKEVFTFYWYNKNREDATSEDDSEFYPVMRTHFYIKELEWVKQKVMNEMPLDNIFSTEELNKVVSATFEGDDTAKIRVDIPTRQDHMYIKVNSQGYMVLFSRVDETELTSGILYFDELILKMRLVCMRMGLKGMFVHYATKDTLFKKGKSLAGVFLNLNSEFGDFHLIDSLKSKKANGYTKYVMGWNNPLRETDK